MITDATTGKRRASVCDYDGEAKEVRKVLVLYTGGTIGMKPSPNGYICFPNYLQDYLESNPQFTDPEIPTVITESGRKLLVTPKSRFAGGRRTRYEVLEFPVLLDSCNMHAKEWLQIAAEIEKNYNKYDAFVVIHGTDTMAYTACVLSFILENLRKTVIITGSQVPLTQSQNDGTDNLLGAITMCGLFEIPEVCLYFNQKLFRGNRTSKVCSSHFNAFDSPNFPPIAKIGTDCSILWDNILAPKLNQPFRVHKTLETNVAAIRLYPGIQAATLDLFMREPMRGIVLHTYGAGNGPDQDKAFLAALKRATDRGIIIINVTQCLQGGVEAHYATGSALVAAGVIPGNDMTIEAAMSKLTYVLGLGLSKEESIALCKANLRGEFTSNDKNRFSFQNTTFVQSVAESLSAISVDASASGDKKAVANALAPTMMCAAAGNGDTKQVQALLESNISPNVADYDARTPLHIAAAEQNLEIARVLMEAGARVNAADRWGHTPLQESIQHADNAVLPLFLIENGAKFGDNDVASQLCSAAHRDDTKLLTVMGECGLDLSVGDYDDRTALHLAACEGKINSVRVLLKYGADPAALDRWGNSVIQEAERVGNQEILSLLRAAAAASDAQNLEEKTQQN